MGFRDRIAHAWNAFTQQDQQALRSTAGFGASYASRPDRLRTFGLDRSIISSVYTRLGIDVAAIDIRHVRLNDQDEFADNIISGLNTCLTLEANIDQGARAFKQDIAMTLFERGVAAIVPIDTTLDPTQSSAYDIKTMRVGYVVDWFPTKVRVNVYNEKLGQRQDIILDKSYVAIVENPLYAVMNEPNGTLQRLLRKLTQLDAIDDQTSSGKLDMIIQLPYVIKSEARREQAEQRRKDIEVQLKGSQYGIAYTDGTERITQLNRPVENNMMNQITYLTTMLYGQLGLTEAVFNGTANEAEMLNYYNRTIEPLLSSITEAMKRTFLTNTARTQKQSIEFFRDPFRLVPMQTIADIADKFTRNEIMSSNEIRSKIGLKPSTDPKANMLQNSNMPQPGAPAVPSADPNAGLPVDPNAAPVVNPADSIPPADTPVSMLA